MTGSEKPNKIVLAYSGGLDTSVMLHWLKRQYSCQIVCYTADVGQDDELIGLEAKALNSGAVRAYIDDLREEFVRDFVYPAVQANAVYEGCYLLGTSLARPLIAKRQAEIARIEGADAVAHGATGKGNDQVRFELTYQALAPELKIVAPWREWPFKSRSDLIEYAREHAIPVTASVERPYSIDRNLMHTSYEGGILEDPWREPPEEIFLLTLSPQLAPDRATDVQIEFFEGIPVKVDGQKLGPVELVTLLNEMGGQNGIGRVDLVENRFVGMKSRGVYETPGVTLLQTAHRALESITMDREVMHLRDTLIPRISELIYYGFWYSPEFRLLTSFVRESQKDVTGTVKLRLYKGNCTVVGRKAPRSLYSEALATFEKDSVYNQRDAEGFIRLNALRLKLQSYSKSNALSPQGSPVSGASEELKK